MGYVIILGTVMEKNKNCGWLHPRRKNLGRNDFHPCSFARAAHSMKWMEPKTEGWDLMAGSIQKISNT